jgi:hypothetical protein
MPLPLPYDKGIGNGAQNLAVLLGWRLGWQSLRHCLLCFHIDNGYLPWGIARGWHASQAVS